MGVKRINLGPQSQPEKRGKAYHIDDRLSGLPNDVLIVILSSLPLREAARSGLLSSRWTNLWRHSLCLNFDSDDALDKFAAHNKQLNVERRKYINWVNSVLRSHKAPVLDEFSISFDFDKSSHKAIRMWLEFALARSVQRLELSRIGYTRTYDFPTEFLERRTRKSPYSGTLLKSLKVLCLRRINVTGEDIDFFLRNCPLLEQLIVQGSHKISKVEVCGASLALKHLEIFDSYPFLPPIKISAPNLTSLKVKTLEGLLLENVPMLVELNLMCGYCDLYKSKLVHIQQLKILTVNLTLFEQSELCELPQMPKLKKLKVEYVTSGSSYEGYIMKLTSFIKASPQLQELEIKMNGTLLWRRREVGDGIMHFTHQHLKVLKLSGYYEISPIEFVRNILMNCVALQKIIIDTHFQQSQSYLRPTREDIVVMEETARSHAKKLEPHVPNHIELLVL